MRNVLSFALASMMGAAAVHAEGPVVFPDEVFHYDREHPAAGHWLGNLDLGVGVPMWLAVNIDRGDDGVWSARSTLFAIMAINAECTELAIDGREVAFKIPMGSADLAGTVSDDGQRMTGELDIGAAGRSGGFELARLPRPADLGDPLAFEGELVSDFGNLPLTMIFAETPGGNWVGQMDVPAQGLVGCPFSSVSMEGGVLAAKLVMPHGTAAIEAKLAADRSRLAGTFTQGPVAMEFDFERNTDYVSPEMKRPQEPKPPWPYEVTDVEVEHPNGHVLAGTLTMPSGSGPFPAAILVSGSGSQNRNEEIMGHKPFLVIADHLTRHGIAVLRYDDRGFAGSTGEASGATSADLSTDAEAVFDYLRTVDGVDPKRVGIIGHSEGGLIAPMVAARNPHVAFAVLLAGPGVPGSELLTVQVEKLLRAGGATDVLVAQALATQEATFELMRSKLQGEAFKDEMRPVVKASLETTGGLDGEDLDQAVDAQLSAVASPWMRYFVQHDPRPDLRKTGCPVFALNGTLDLQVWHDQNLPAIEKAITEGGGAVTIRRYENLNHLFQPATTGSVGEYAMIETTFDETVLRDMVEWIRDKTGS